MIDFKVAIVGRPNVGKSSLFNRLTGTKHAIVHDMPGVTRDRRDGNASLGSLEFVVTDTPGIEEAERKSLEYRMMMQTSQAIEEADAVILMVDGRVGLLPDDSFFSQWVRKFNKPHILVINKCESRNVVTKNISDFYSLGIEAIACISAEHGEGLVDLYEELSRIHQQISLECENNSSGCEQDDTKNDVIQIAVVGRPNAGKSTLINQLLHTDRVLTGPEAGITRDSIAVDWHYQGRNFKLVDTAGIRRRSKVDSSLEIMAVKDSMRSIQYANVVVLLVDAAAPLEAQDISIAHDVVTEGRALVIAINKCDDVTDIGKLREHVEYKISTNLAQIKGVPVIYMSALRGNGIQELINASLGVYELWNKRVSTAKLNDWLQIATERHPLPLSRLGRRLKIKYATQTKTRPPTILLFTNLPDELPQSYLRYLISSFRDYFDIPAVPIRLTTKKSSNNPYKNES